MTWPGWENFKPPVAVDYAKGTEGSQGPTTLGGSEPSKPTAKKQPSQAIVFQCKALGLPVPVAEFRFHDTRRWLFDWAWPDRKIELEQEGVVYQKAEGQQHMLGGRHVSVTGFKKDLEKYGTAFSLGWRVLRCLPEQIEDGQAVQWLEPILKC